LENRDKKLCSGVSTMEAIESAAALTVFLNSAGSRQDQVIFYNTMQTMDQRISADNASLPPPVSSSWPTAPRSRRIDVHAMPGRGSGYTEGRSVASPEWQELVARYMVSDRIEADQRALQEGATRLKSGQGMRRSVLCDLASFSGVTLIQQESEAIAVMERVSGEEDLLPLYFLHALNAERKRRLSAILCGFLSSQMDFLLTALPCPYAFSG
jgi:hypothetical protein